MLNKLSSPYEYYDTIFKEVCDIVKISKTKF